MTRYDPAVHHRQSIRLRHYDYRQAGAYFVTLCTQGRELTFGEIVADAMHRNAYGAIVAEDWMALATQFGYVDLDTFVVMPNHLHGIIVMDDTPGQAGKRLSLGRIVGTFKTQSTKHVNEWRETPGAPLWQRNYYEHVIRDAADWERIREYIVANPARWTQDEEYAPP